MAIVPQILVYDGPGGPFEGVMAHDDAVTGKRPGVLVLPNYLGQKDSDTAHAEWLAARGCTALVADVFGQGRRAKREEADVSRYMDELTADRGLLRDRLAVSLAALSAQDGVDSARLAAIGFCFGGLGVLDMARAGLPILAGVSFHGVYGRPDYATATPMAAKLLVCHGWNDPLAPPQAVVGLAAELTEARADWQLLAHGHAGHAFTDLSMRDQPSGHPGIGYDAHADQRSWAATEAFLADVLG